MPTPTLPSNPINVFDMSFLKKPHLEVATHIIGIGDAFMVHDHYQVMPEGMPHGKEIKEVGTRYHDATYAVMAGDNGKKAERDACAKEAILLTMLALNWAAMKYMKENNPAYINNLAVEHASKKAPTRNVANAVPDAPTKVILKRGKLPGILLVLLGKTPGAITYFIQACMGDPNVPENWNQEWQFTKIRGGVELTGLEPGKVYYIRVRCLGHAGYGPWSGYVHIMVA